MDSGDYDSAISEIEKIKYSSSDESYSFIQKIKDAKGIYIYKDYYMNGGASPTESYSLTEELWTTPKNCKFHYENGLKGASGTFSTGTFDEIIEMMCNGNPKEYEPKVEPDGRWAVEKIPMVLKIRTLDKEGHEGYNLYLFVDCDNLEAIYERFEEIRQAALKGTN